MATTNNARDQAEAQFKKPQKPGGADDQVLANREAGAQAGRDKTANLKSLRLAKEAADRETRDKAVPVRRLKSQDDL